MTTSTFLTSFGESSFADSMTAVWSASKHWAHFGFDPKVDERPPIPMPVMLERWAVLIATAALWLIVAWAVWPFHD